MKIKLHHLLLASAVVVGAVGFNAVDAQAQLRPTLGGGTPLSKTMKGLSLEIYLFQMTTVPIATISTEMVLQIEMLMHAPGQQQIRAAFVS